MKVAVAQIQAEGLDIAGNLARTTAAIEQAAAQGATLTILPETVSTGWILDPEGMAAVAEPGDGSGPVLSAWRAAAREHGTAVIAGYPEQAGDRLYNAVTVIGRDGTVLGNFRKLHLFGREREMFEPGDQGLPIFEIDGVKVGVLVCYDLRFPEAMRLLALRGAELIAVPTAWVIGYDPNTTPQSTRIGQVEGVRVQANLNQVYVACADLAGEIDGVEFLGRSLISSPYGDPIAGPAPAEGEHVLVADIDPAEAARARDRGDGISPRHDRRTDVYSLDDAGGAPEVNGSAPVDGAALLAEMERKRGYVLDLHRTLAERDPEFLVDYENFLNAAFLRERSLDRRVKELVYIGVLMAINTTESHLIAHMRAAVDNGATEAEVLEVLEQVLAPAGVPSFIRAMAAYAKTFEHKPVDA